MGKLKARLVLFTPADKVRHQYGLVVIELLCNFGNIEICSDDCVIHVCVCLFFFFFKPQSSYPIWEDFTTKAGKLQSQLR